MTVTEGGPVRSSKCSVGDSQQQIEDELELEIAAHARIVILRHMKKDFGMRRFMRRDYWLILVFGV